MKTTSVKRKPRTETSLLVENGARLDREIKERTKRLDEIKIVLRELGDGEYIGETAKAVVSEKKMTDVSSAKFLEAYEADRMTRSQFIRAISVGVDAARELLSPKAFTAATTERVGTSPVRFLEIAA